MGIPAESPVIRLRSRPGLALPAAIFGIVVVSLITAGLFAITSLDTQATKNRVDAATALRLAQTAETHALSLLRTRLKDTTFNRLLAGFDNLPLTPDDGLLTGYPGLGDSLNILATGRAAPGGTYFVKISDDPRDADGLPFVDSNMRLLVNCRGVTTSGSSAEVNVIVSNFSLPGIAVDGNLEISSSLQLSGGCGGIHANGSLTGGGAPTISTVATATGSITLNVSPKLAGQPPIEIPDLNPADFCGDPGYVYVSTGYSNFSGTTWKPTSANFQPGKVYCVAGNVEFNGDFGSLALPWMVSVIATGSIKNGKKTFMTAAHPDGIVLMGGGDIDLQAENGFVGLVYGGGQCYISDKTTIIGQLICKNKNPHPGADYFSGTQTLISGDAKITYDCNSMLSHVWKVVSWYPTIGS